jgi:hypothetical protein
MLQGRTSRVLLRRRRVWMLQETSGIPRYERRVQGSRILVLSLPAATTIDERARTANRPRVLRSPVFCFHRCHDAKTTRLAERIVQGPRKERHPLIHRHPFSAIRLNGSASTASAPPPPQLPFKSSSSLLLCSVQLDPRAADHICPAKPLLAPDVANQ